MILLKYVLIRFATARLEPTTSGSSLLRDRHNSDLVKELIDGKAPQVNRVSFDIACPSAALLEGMFGFSDEEIISVMSRKTASLVVDVKPDFCNVSLCIYGGIF